MFGQRFQHVRLDVRSPTIAVLVITLSDGWPCHRPLLTTLSRNRLYGTKQGDSFAKHRAFTQSNKPNACSSPTLKLHFFGRDVQSANDLPQGLFQQLQQAPQLRRLEPGQVRIEVQLHTGHHPHAVPFFHSAGC